MKRTASVLLIILLCFSLSGCWSRRELNGLAITVGIGIDKQGDNYIVSAQVVEPSEVVSQASSNLRLPVTLFRQSSTSLHEALRKMTINSPRRMYLAHLRMLIIQEELAREGIKEVLDFFIRHYEIRTDYFVTVARDHSAADILKVLTPIENIPTNAIFTSLETSEKFWAPTHGVHMDELVNSLLEEGTNPVLTGIRIVGDTDAINYKFNVEMVESPAQLGYTGLGIFREDKLIGWLNEEDSKGFNYIQGNVSSTVGHTECPDGGRIMSAIYKTKSRITGKLLDGEPAINIDLFVEGNVSEVSCDIDLTNPDTVSWLEAQNSRGVKELIEKVIDKAQHEYKTDFLGFGAAFRRAYPQEWKKIGKNWDTIFETLPVNIEVQYKNRRVGSITNLFSTEKE